MVFTINSREIENEEVEITTDDDGALSLLHKPTGQKIGLDPDGTLQTPAGEFGELNNVRHPGPGEVQAAIDELDDNPDVGTSPGNVRGRVVLDPERKYAPAETWMLKEGITLHGPVIVEPQHDGVFLYCQHGTRFTGPIVFDARNRGPGFVGVRLDGEVEGKYDDENAVQGEVEVWGPRGDGTGIELHAGTTNEQAISNPNRFWVNLLDLDKGIYADANESWINDVVFRGHTENCHTSHIEHDGVASTDPDFASTFIGTAQAGSGEGETIMRNYMNSSCPTFRFEGMIWDVSADSTANGGLAQKVMRGPSLTAVLNHQSVSTGSWINDVLDGSEGQFVETHSFGARAMKSWSFPQYGTEMKFKAGDSSYGAKLDINEGSGDTSVMRWNSSTVGFNADAHFFGNNIQGIGDLRAAGSAISLKSDVDTEDEAIYNLNEYTGATASDLETGEWAWDTDHDGAGTPAWIFKDSGGSLHYFEPTG